MALTTRQLWVLVGAAAVLVVGIIAGALALASGGDDDARPAGGRGCHRSMCFQFRVRVEASHAAWIFVSLSAARKLIRAIPGQITGRGKQQSVGGHRDGVRDAGHTIGEVGQQPTEILRSCHASCSLLLSEPPCPPASPGEASESP